MNKKLFLSTLICFLLADLAYSQIRIGGRLSGSMANITDVHSYSKSRGGFQVGVFGLIPITNNDILFFQPEVNFSAQGEFDQPRRSNGSYEKQQIFLNYINVPLHAKLYFTDAESEFFVEGGPYLGFKIGENIEDVGYPTEAGNNEFSSFDFGATLGVGFSLNRQFEASLRYSYGLVDQVPNDAANASNSTSILNLGISYIFN